MAKGTISFGKMLLQASLAAILIIGGLSVFLDGKSDEMVKAVGGIFRDSTIRDIVVYVLAIVEIAAGVLLVLDFFQVGALDRINSLSLLVVIIVWGVFMLMVDLLPLLNDRIRVVKWLAQLAQHVLVLASLIIVRARV